MKKTVSANINGKIYNIDEDAYHLLQNYLSQLRLTFCAEDSIEIVNDIESRISELFDERLANGSLVIVIDDVNRVIETMGRPEELSDRPETADNQGGTNAGSTANNNPISNPRLSAYYDEVRRKRLYRNMRNKVFGGVLGGIATTLNWNATILRILIVVAAIVTEIWPLSLVYLLAWMIIPAAKTPRQILQMQGEPVNINTVGQTVVNTTTPPPYYGNENESFTDVFSKVLLVMAKILMGIIGITFCIVAVTALVLSVVIFFGIILWISFDNGAILDGLNLHYFSPSLYASRALIWCLVSLIPSIAIVWAACCMIFHARGASRTTIIAAAIIEIVLIIAGVCLTVGEWNDYFSYGVMSLIGTSSLPSLLC